MTTESVKINMAGRLVGLDSPPYVIAEMSGNHKGSLDLAIELVHAAADAGADAIKIQTYTADTMTIDVDLPEFHVEESHPLWGGRSLWSLYDEAKTPYEWHETIFTEAKKLGLDAFSTPFDNSAVDFLEELGVPMYKIASLELTDLPLIRYVAETGKPVILSTGASTLEEIDLAVEAARGVGCSDLVVLGCVSSYPALPEESNLRSLPSLAERYDCVVGLSDHTLDATVPAVAVALGARVIEKHLTLSREDGSVDSEFSLEPDEFKQLVRDSRVAFESLGSGEIKPSPGETESRRSRRSLYVVADVEAGDMVSAANVRAIRPGSGLQPDAIRTLEGKSFAQAVKKGTPVSLDLISEE